MLFEDLSLSKSIQRAVFEEGYTSPTPIQEKAIPFILAGKDLVGCAQTGTGKTAAFAIPIIHNLHRMIGSSKKTKEIRCLVVTPTRELAVQIGESFDTYGKYTNIRQLTVFGGVSQLPQVDQLKKGLDILIATPGRLLDLHKQGFIDFDSLHYLVLDESDLMLDMGFINDVRKIVKLVPTNRQTLLFSATMPNEVARIARTYMTDPLEVSIGHKNQSNENIEHIYYSVKERDRYDAVKRLIDFNPTIYGLIFCRTKNETATVAMKLARDGYNAEPLHGDLTQAMRDRVMDRFRSKELQILVATDVAARGLDINNITHVINYNLPDDIENYTHRSGRTARAGKKGQSLVLVSPRENGKIKAIERQMRTTFTLGQIPDPKEICEIQLKKLIDSTIATEVKEGDIEPFMEQILDSFKDLSKEEVIKRFVSAEFNRFIDYYERAGDLNAAASKDDRERPERNTDRKSRAREEGKTRFFVNLGRRDGLNPGAMVRIICDATGLNSKALGRIDIMTSFSFIEADDEHTQKILKHVDGYEFEGHKVSIEVTAPGQGGGSDRGERKFSKGPGSKRGPGSFGGGKKPGFDRKPGFEKKGGFDKKRSGGFDRDRGFGAKKNNY
jgi:ATP-dependent RNA helicase DeaD